MNGSSVKVTDSNRQNRTQKIYFYDRYNFHFMRMRPMNINTHRFGIDEMIDVHKTNRCYIRELAKTLIQISGFFLTSLIALLTILFNQNKDAVNYLPLILLTIIFLIISIGFTIKSIMVRDVPLFSDKFEYFDFLLGRFNEEKRYQNISMLCLGLSILIWIIYTFYIIF